MKGSYILLMHLTKDTDIKIGKMGTITFKKGYYAYVGSGLNSLEARIKRHLRSEKKMHWHIDYFLHEATIDHVFYKKGDVREECDLASLFSYQFSSILHFGCSDCKCKSHLFYGTYNDFFTCINGLNLTGFNK